MTESTQPGRKRATLYLALIFLCGALTGAVVTNRWSRWPPWNASANADVPRNSPQHTVEKFTKELSLSPDQAKKLNEILDETHSTYRELEAQQEAIREKGRARIREILTPEQRPKYEQLLAGIEARRKLQQRH